MTSPKFDAAGLCLLRSTALLLAVAVTGAFMPCAAWAANPTARGVFGYYESEDTYVVVGLNDPADPDYLLVINEVIPAGSIDPGDPDNDLDPVPAEDLSIVQIVDIGDPADPATWEGLIELNPLLEDYGVVEVSRIKFYLLGGDDTLDARELTGDSAVTLEVYGGPGDDTIYGGEADDELNGDDGNDLIFGGMGADEIDGGPGDDILNGGDDGDTITGGPGNDLVRGDRGGDDLSGGGGWDVVDYATDVGPGAITVNFPDGSATDGWGDSDSVRNFSAIRGKATNDTLIGHEDLPTTIVGGGGDDAIIGGSRQDVLIGDGGHDTIQGHGGGDIIIGGSGDDTIYGYVDPDTEPLGDDGADIISGDGTADWMSAVDENGIRADGPDGLEDRPWDWPPLGYEPVQDPAFWGPLFPPAPPGVENPENPDQPIQPGTVLLQNLSIGNDAIKGAGGSDIIYGCGGSDRINGDDPWTPSNQVGSHLIFGDYDYDLDNDGYFEFGNPAIGAGWDDRIWGGAGVDLIVGGPGSDILAGGGGNDVLSGNGGSDIIIGDDCVMDTTPNEGFATGTPSFIQGSSNDTVDYTATGSGIVLSLGSVVNAIPGVAMDGELDETGQPAPGMDTIMAVENVIGSFYDDVIQGSDDNLPTTALGNPAVMDVNGNPVASISDVAFVAPAGLNMLYTPPTGFDNFLIGGFGNDTILGGMGVDAIIGDYPQSYAPWQDSIPPDVAAIMVDGDDVLYGDNGSRGEGHNDWISGCGGDDEIYGDGGDDTIRGGTGADILNGDAGIDTLDYSEFGLNINTSSPVRVNLSHTTVDGQPANSATDGGIIAPDGTVIIAPAVDTIENGRTNPRNRFEIVFGSNVTGPLGVPADTPPIPDPDGDVLIGHESLPMVMYGLAGNDVLIGGHYEPTVANDRNMPLPLLYGGRTLYSGDDYLDGGQGDDVLMPGTGNDTAIGGNGGEVNGDFVSYANLTAPDPVTNRLGVTVSLSDTQPQPTRIAGTDRILGCENLTGSPFDDQLTGNELPNWIIGGAGDDQLRGGADLDVVINNEAVVREDYLVGGDGYDDAVYIAGNPAQVSVDLSQGLTAGDGEGGSDRLWEIENALISNPSLIVSAGSDQVAAKGGSVVLNASVSWPGGFPPYQYRWEPADGLDDPTVLQPTASPERTTTYKLTVTDRFGAVDADFVTVKVVDALVVSAGPDRTISLGQSAQLEGEASGGVTPYTYVWTPSDGLSRTDVARPLASPNHDTTYTLTVTDGLGRSASDTVVVRVTSPFSISAGSDVSILPGGSAILNVTINGGAPPFAIHWTPATGLSADNVADPIAQPSATTAYTVRVTDALGREASDTLIVTVTLGSGTDTPGGGPDQPGGGQGPRTSPPGGDDETPPGAAPVGCGGGMAMALAVNALALLLLRRRRAD